MTYNGPTCARILSGACRGYYCHKTIVLQDDHCKLQDRKVHTRSERPDGMKMSSRSACELSPQDRPRGLQMP
eukprot:4564909-Amphidinium_carterae.1